MIGNARGTPTHATLLIGLAAGGRRSPWDGTYLVQPSLARTMVLPESGAVTVISIPCEIALCQAAGHLQVLDEDPGASKGMSFSAGVRLRVGDRWCARGCWLRAAPTRKCDPTASRQSALMWNERVSLSGTSSWIAPPAGRLL